MHQKPSNLQEVRENLSEAAYTAWQDKSFVPRAVVMVNAMGKIVQTVALGLKAAEINKSAYHDPMLGSVDVTPRINEAAS
jgi:hypothetical protein